MSRDAPPPESDTTPELLGFLTHVLLLGVIAWLFGYWL
jgi:hypothetical protein